MRALAAVLLALVSGACVSVSWTRSTNAVALDPGWVELEPGTATLEDALAVLGAPLYVHEYEVNGLLVAWGRYREDVKGIRVTIPLQDSGPSPDVDYRAGSSGLRGVMMVFDPQYRLVSVREGLLIDLHDDRYDPPRPTPPLRRDMERP